MKFPHAQQKGFTILETLIAVLILTLALNSLFGLITDSLFSAQYARNEITAMYLAQEAIDHIRNDRDTVAFQGGLWPDFITRYGGPSGGCFDIAGCFFDASDWVTLPSSQPCPTGSGRRSTCPALFVKDVGVPNGYYSYNSGGTLTSFVRQINMDLANGGDEVLVTVTVNWENGSVNRSQVLRTSLLRWR